MTASTSATDSSSHGVPLGQGAPEEPAHTLPAEPSNTTSARNQGGQDANPANTKPQKNQANEEPELALEPDLPSDGRDEKGEAMIRDLPQQTDTSDKPDASPEKS